MDALQSALASRPYNALQKPRAFEMDFVTASRTRYHFDKLLLLIHPGEDESQVQQPNGKQQTEKHADPSLTARGFEQALKLSKMAAKHCNHKTGLEPELIVVSPLTRVLQTTLLTFPDCSRASVGSTRWICHPALSEPNLGIQDLHSDCLQDFQLTFPGMDYSLFLFQDSHHFHRSKLNQRTTNTENRNRSMALLESKETLLQQADQFVDWLKNRPEHVIVGKLAKDRFARNCDLAYVLLNSSPCMLVDGFPCLFIPFLFLLIPLGRFQNSFEPIYIFPSLLLDYCGI